MFFVGIGGHFITLALTVALPFVLLIAGDKNIQLPENSFQLEIKTQRFSPATENATNRAIIYSHVAVEKVTQTPLLPPVTNSPMPSAHYCIRWRGRLFQSAAGNKAPPVNFKYLV